MEQHKHFENMRIHCICFMILDLKLILSNIFFFAIWKRIVFIHNLYCWVKNKFLNIFSLKKNATMINDMWAEIDCVIVCSYCCWCCWCYNLIITCIFCELDLAHEKSRRWFSVLYDRLKWIIRWWWRIVHTSCPSRL